MKKSGGAPVAVLAATLLGVLAALPGQARAEDEARLRVGSVLATAVYAPAKVLYAATGVIVGGIGWGLSGGSREAMDAVMNPAVEGDYVITPEHLRGERPVEFVGAAPVPEALEPEPAGDPDYDAFGYEY
jgi:hypothetical protein